MSRSERAQQLLTATLGYTTAAMAAGETVAKLAVDVKDFLHSDADAPVPPSLRQALRVLNTPELEECAARVTSGVARGVAAATSGGGVDGGRREGGDEDGGDGPATSSLDAVLDRVLDPRNWGLASVIVSGATRQALEAVIDAFREQYGAGGGGADAPASSGGESSTVNDVLDKMLRMAASPEGKSVLLDLCSVFVSAAVGTYLDKTQDANSVFDDFFAAATRASNREAMQDIAGRVTGETVRTMVEVLSPNTSALNATRGAAARRSESRAAYARDSVNVGAASPAAGGIDGSFTVGAAHAHVGLVTPGAQSVFQTLDAGAGFDAMSTEESPVAVNGENGRSDAGDGSARDASSPSGSDDTDLAEPSSVDPATTQAHAAAAFTSALFSDLGPQFFKIVVAPEGRSLIAEVAGTCTASAVRSFVLSLRDCVFVTSKDGRTWSVTSYAVNAARVAAFAFAFFWVVACARLAAAWFLVGVGGETVAGVAASEVAPLMAAAGEAAPLIAAAGEAAGVGGHSYMPWYAWAGLCAPGAFVLRWAKGAATQTPPVPSQPGARGGKRSRNQDYVLGRLHTDVTYK